MRLHFHLSKAITQRTQLLHCFKKKKKKVNLDGCLPTWLQATCVPNPLKLQQGNIWSQIHLYQTG